MTMPTAEASIAFTTDPLAAPSWTVIQQPRAFSTKRLRSPQLGRFESGTFDGVFGNTNRSLEPLYASGANYPNVRVRKRMRLRATHNSITYPVYDGFIESIKPTYPAKGIDAIASLSASDAFRIFAGYPLVVPYQAEVLKDSPTGYWQFNESTGAVTAADSSGNSNNGTYSAAGITFGVVDPITDNLNGAITLDGSSGSVTLLSMTVTGALTMEAWVKVNSVPSGAVAFIISSEAVPASTPSWYLGVLGSAFGADQGKAYCHMNGGNVQSAASICDAAWHHLVATRDGSNNLSLYLDGSLVAGPTAIGAFSYPLMPIKVGVEATPNIGGWLPGSVDEIAIYNGTALSSTRITAHYNARTAYLGQTSDARVTTILDTVGWPSADRDLSTGIATLGGAGDLGTKKALDHLRDVDGTEGGALFMSRAGAVTFRDRHATQGGTTASSTSQMTFGDGGGAEVPYTDLVIAFDDKEFANQITVSRLNGVTSVATDSASVTKYGAQGYSRTSLASTDTDSISLGQWLLTLLKDPNKLRFETITVALDSPLTNAAIAAVLGREIWDRVTVAFQPPGGGARISQDVIVTGISHKVSPSRWDVSFQVSGTEIGTMMWRLGTAGFGELGQTTYLGY